MTRQEAKKAAEEYIAKAKEAGEVPGEGWKDNGPLMACGCTANATNGKDGSPTCVVHDCNEVIERPDLTDRVARCETCGRLRLSSYALPFFRYRGPGSAYAEEHCVNCGFLKVAHERPDRRSACDNFENDPEGHPMDTYYCGCRGWD